MVGDIENLFPRLQGSAYQITSPPSDVYNCIAWAASDPTCWWWPGDPVKDHWPPGAARDETIDAFREAFETLGFVMCAAEGLEPGFEKIAVFADDQGTPTHAARQLPTGQWTSKLGQLEDIQHSLHDLTGNEYGTVALIMKRAFTTSGGP
jgi:hypothetical protein